MSDPKHPAGHQLQAFHDGELEPAIATELETHCLHCPTCRAELDDLARVGGILASTRVPELPRTVWPRV